MDRVFRQWLLGGIALGAVLAGASSCGDKDTYIIVQAGGASGFGSGAEGGSSPGGSDSGGGNSGGSSSEGGTSQAGGSTQSGGAAGTVGSGGSGAVGTCAGTSFEVAWTRAPTDVILVVDNSGSMIEKMPAVETAVNTNFAASLTASGIDYRVILISRNRREPFESSDMAATSICITSPLSGLATCPAEAPLFAERFFQYGDKVESIEAFNMILSAYNMPDLRENLAPQGYSAWLRPGASKVFIVIVDEDVPAVDGGPMPYLTFVSSLTALAPADFGSAASPTFTYHSIAGTGEKLDPTAPYLPEEPVQTVFCTGSDVFDAGVNHQEVSRLTGGLRFPICQYPAMGQMLEAIVAHMATNAAPGCDALIPVPPEGVTLDPTQATVTLNLGAGDTTLTRVGTAGECTAGAFYLDTARIYLCPEACSALQASSAATIRAVLGCSG